MALAGTSEQTVSLWGLACVVSEGDFLIHSRGTWQPDRLEACVYCRRQLPRGWGFQA